MPDNDVPPQTPQYQKKITTTELLQKYDGDVLDLLKGLVINSAQHFVQKKGNFPIFNDYIGSRTLARICPFSHMNDEHRVMAKYLTDPTDPYNLFNLIIYRVFFVVKAIVALGYCTDGQEARQNVLNCKEKALPLPPMHGMTWWRDNMHFAGADNFPIKSLCENVRCLDNLGQLSVALVVQDLAAFGVITEKAIISFLEDTEHDFTLIGKGGKEGLALLYTDLEGRDSGGKSVNGVVLDLYRKMKPTLVQALTESIEEDDMGRWVHPLAVEHVLCRFYRMAKWVANKASAKQMEFWLLCGLSVKEARKIAGTDGPTQVDTDIAGDATETTD
ncbi:hypothetical protein HDV00_004362 [Rhizophlyctis rosea]|nr:hypothetical protein HDV00_004362 [Rhizophlyctis rosea]